MTPETLNCRKAAAQMAMEKKGDYVSPVKGNHPVMYREIKNHMDAIAARRAAGFEIAENTMVACNAVVTGKVETYH